MLSSTAVTATTTKRFRAKIEKHPDNAALFFDVPFDPKEVFGKVRAPVKVTIGSYAFRTTIVAMGGRVCIGLSRMHREGSGVEAGQTVAVAVERDDEPRTVEIPRDLAVALAGSPRAKSAWDALSYTHRREHVEAIESAKKPETRARRIDKALEMLTRSGRSRA